MNKRTNKKIRQRNHRGVKSYEYPIKAISLQQQLLERAIVIGERKQIIFSGDAALWLKDTTETTAQTVMARFPAGPVAMDDRLIAAIEEAFRAIRKILEVIANSMMKSSKPSAERLTAILQSLCPLPPIC